MKFTISREVLLQPLSQVVGVVERALNRIQVGGDHVDVGIGLPVHLLDALERFVGML